MHAPGNGDEDAIAVGQRRVLAQHVLEDADSRATGMFGLSNLGQLQWIAKQN